MNEIKQKKIIGLDLEGTIIETFDAPKIINENVEFIKRELENNGDFELIIFSLAISNIRDKTHFEFHIKEQIENLLEREINDILILSDEFIKDIMRKSGFCVLDDEFPLNLLGKFPKEMLFEMFIGMEQNVDALLIDDRVRNKTISFPDSNNSIHFVKPPKILS
jgi:hypothetical protein